MCLEFSSLGINQPSAYCQHSRIFCCLHTTLISLYSLPNSNGHFLYTLYEVPLYPGADLLLAFLTISVNCTKVGSFMLNCIWGVSGIIRFSQFPSSVSRNMSLCVCLKCSSTSSIVLSKVPPLGLPNSSDVNLYGLFMNLCLAFSFFFLFFL